MSHVNEHEGSGILEEIREVNLAYLLLAQRLLRENKQEGMFRLGLSKEIAEILTKLTPAQTIKLATFKSVLCQFRFKDQSLLSRITEPTKCDNMRRFHAAILLAQQPVESIK